MSSETENIVSRVMEWNRGKKPGPYGIEISPSLRCNANCLFCWRRGKEKIDYLEELPYEKYAEIVNDAAQMGVREFKIIGGGEATIRKDMFRLMELIKKMKMRGYLCTNGTLFTESDIESLVKAGWDYVKISLHGPDAKTHDEITTITGSFERATAAAKLFKKYKEKYKTHLPAIEFGFVAINKNYKSIPLMLELTRQLGVEALFIEPITTYSALGESLRLTDDEMIELSSIAARAIGYAEKNRISTNLSQFATDSTDKLVARTNKMDAVIMDMDKQKKKKNEDDGRSDGFENIPCFEPFYRMGIRTDGQIGPCGFLDDESTENIRHKTLAEVWHGKYMSRMRENMANQQLGEQCRRCCTTLVANNSGIREAIKAESASKANIWRFGRK